ncbi:hypothetical protein [uncultured Jannaschia sp.]|uniref:hypothetical protein n=1 Tax=uncultured Jannaschia sp. TaxID=293347 RepID=UPI0026178F4A|nr:hypothetical protein [uncultured Jannaschia sp.]
MRNLLLSVALIAAPVAVFAAGYVVLTPPAAQTAAAIPDAAPPLGDMTPFAAITTDVQSVAATGDLAAAEMRITELETAWDDAQATLRPVNTAAWGHVDGAIDDALSALRTGSPDAAGQVDAALAALQGALADPTAGTAPAAGGPGTVSGIVVTDASGRALPCEVMLEQLRTGLVGSAIPDPDRTAATALQAKATERCNADDDARSDAFSAQALALLPN